MPKWDFNKVAYCNVIDIALQDVCSSLTRVFPHNDRIYDSVTIRQNMDQRHPVLWNILCSTW